MTARRASRSQVRSSRTAELVGQVVRDLAHQHDVHRLVAERRRARAADGARARRPPGASRAATGLRSSPTGTSRMPRRRGPAHRRARQVAEAGAEVQQRERGARGHAGERARQPVPHRRGAAEPPVGAGDVAERLGDRGGVGRRIVEQLGADRAEVERLPSESRERGVAAAIVEQRVAVAGVAADHAARR